MRFDWASMFVIFVAIVLAELFCRGVFSGGSIGGMSTSVGAKTHSPAEPVVVYANPIDEFIAKNHPDARR